MICVYVAIGQKESTVAAVVETLREHNALDYTIVVSAGSSDPAPLHTLRRTRPAQWRSTFMYEQGKGNALHLRRPVEAGGRVPPLSLLFASPAGPRGESGRRVLSHSRCWSGRASWPNATSSCRRTAPAQQDRAVNQKVYVGVPGKHQSQHDLEAMPNKDGLEVKKIPSSGGSLTALPVIETLEGEVSAYIPTNVITSPTGRSTLVPDLFFAGIRPRSTSHQRVARGRQRTEEGHEEGGGLVCVSTSRHSVNSKRSHSSARSWTRRRNGSSTAASAWSNCSSKASTSRTM